MRIILSISAAMFVSACVTSSTPTGGSCATRASAELTALQAAIQTSETNLARGYAEEHRMVAGSAQVVRVPLDTAKERQRLAGLQARLGPLQAKTASAVAVCGG